MIEPSPSPHVKIFCSYSHNDEALRQDFVKSVAMLRRLDLVEVWHDREIRAGDRWSEEIYQHLNSADIIVLLVSSDFLDSDFCFAKELSLAMEREAKKETVVIPIIVRDCQWREASFGRLQGLPTDAKAVTSWANRDEAWSNVAKSLKQTVLEVLEAKKAKLQAVEDQEKAAIQTQNTLFNSPAMVRMMEQWSAALPIIEAKIATLNQDLSTYETVAQVTENRAKIADKSFNNMDAYIRG